MIFTKREFFQRHAPDFAFDKDENELLELGLERKFIVKVGENAYKYNKEKE
jgi:hypothetical protein|tara:strand:+ start:264 stop:416 length:153 start_codon:yes stop_codon:yes gene_type:complete